MATPKGAPGVSTPKNPYVSTPNRLNASPRPNASAIGNKSLAYKSPAVKTPVSIHNHAHRVSISSHPTSTPLAAPAIHDELLNLNSPAAALIASIGNAGLTPIASNQDGLGITTGITPQSIREGLLPPKTPEAERMNRLEQVAKLLKTRVEGRGITREGVERVAQIQGFTILWDEENLTIAGNSVDLEIIFDGLERNAVRDVQLRLNVSGSDEPQLQKDASVILKEHLTASDSTDSPSEAWQSLRKFSIDLEYLSQLDYIDSSVNCFELTRNLYTTLCKIWDEESKHMREHSESNHICMSNVGRPRVDTGGRLGVTCDFWLNRHSYVTIDNEANAGYVKYNDTWTARFSCQKGSPGIHSSFDWLDSEPLKTTVTTEDVFQETQVEKPNWSSLALTKSIAEQQKNADVAMMMDDTGDSGAATLDLTFLCQLDREVLVPANILTGFTTEYPMMTPDRTRLLSYQQALLSGATNSSHENIDIAGRWIKTLPFLDVQRDRDAKVRKHSYSLHTNGVWMHPVDKLQFSHPKHYADALPILRQYALLWSIMRNTLGNASTFQSNESASVATPNTTNQKSRITVRQRSNKNAAQDQLDSIIHSKLDRTDVLKIDISIDLMTDLSVAKVGVVVPVVNKTSIGHNSDFVHMTIEIRRNGSLDVSVLRGPQVLEEDKLRRKATKILGLSEDISVLAEWLLHELEKPS